MVTWFWQRKKRPTGRTLRLRSRGDYGDVDRIDFEALAPDIETFLGQAAYLQLGYFETITRLIRTTPGLADKEALSSAAGAALAKHQRLVALIRDRGDDPTEIMLPFREDLDAFRHNTKGARPQETMLTVHVTAGLLDDFYFALSASYGSVGTRVAQILREDDAREAIVDLVRRSIDGDDQLRALLALWGRRLVGDTLLVARSALRTDSPQRLGEAGERTVEPVFTQLMAAHARRMNEIGLDA
ncbi:ferritin-like fold-containing protein [Microbacterium sp. No. 7]|uniref:ferritin-like fold-containing protein n=1 Tax=Microbacterium sp. No. 7 TaxID=1714373 RepID=UPI0006D1185F|nr:ferritin-like fold-containing protein [Microbacterium sp. No. 7]ALJ19959.1 hypothetical protein AOA12_08575 [Microbacterium sp. No. 7]